MQAYIADNRNSQHDGTPNCQLADVPKQVHELFTVVEKLSQKIYNFTGQPAQPFQSVAVSSPSAWPRLGVKRRREDRRPDVSVPPVNGTKTFCAIYHANHNTRQVLAVYDWIESANKRQRCSKSSFTMFKLT